MTKDRKIDISVKMMTAMQNEVISGASLAKCFRISPAYISNMKREKDHKKVPPNVWEMFDGWFESGAELRNYGLMLDNDSVKVPPIPKKTTDALQDEIDKMEDGIFTKREWSDTAELPEASLEITSSLENTDDVMERLNICFKELIKMGYGVQFSLTYKQKQVR